MHCRGDSMGDGDGVRARGRVCGHKRRACLSGEMFTLTLLGRVG